MITTGADFVKGALRELGVLDPIENGHPEQIADGLIVGSDLLDAWRTDRLLIRGVTRAVYSLTSGFQSYTIGTGGGFDQNYPEAIEFWSVIPNGSATHPIERPRGRPLTYDQWQQIRIKSTTGPYPSSLYYDRSYAAGLGNILVHPIPNTSVADIVLYGRVPSITSLVAATAYDLAPGVTRMIKLNLAMELASRYTKGVTVDLGKLEKRAEDALLLVRRSNLIPKAAPMRGEFLIGSSALRRHFNVYTGGG